MSEKLFYGSNGQFKGSMDGDGCFYDTRHRLIGCVKNGTIYDDCNIPRGYIDSDGCVTDMCNIPTGKEFGENFVGWGGHGSGYVRDDVLGTGHGNDYGAFEQLERHKRNSYPYDYKGYGDNNDGDDGGDDSEYDDYDTDDSSYAPDPPYRRKAMQIDGGTSSETDEVIGCFAYLFVILFFGGLIWFIL